MYKKVTTIIIAFFSLFVVLSCSDGQPKLDDAVCTVVFDYAAPNQNPSVYFSFFVKTLSDISRTASLQLEHVQTGYVWNISEPQVYSDAQGIWTGYACLYARETDHIPQGEYRYTYSTKAGDTFTGTVTLSYPDLLYAISSAEVPAALGKKSNKRVAVYAENRNLLYYGSYMAEWHTDADIWNAYATSTFIQPCYEKKYTDELIIICKMPMQAKQK